MFLGRAERVEDAPGQCRIDTAAGVNDADRQLGRRGLCGPHRHAPLAAVGRRECLDRVVDQVEQDLLDLDAVDQHRLDQYLESIRGVEKRLSERHELLDKGRPQFDEQSVKLQPQGKSGMQEHIEMMMDLVALAFQTDMTRVVTQVLGGEGGPNYDEYKIWATRASGQVRGAHDIHHKGSNGTDTPDVKMLAFRDEMFCACLARLMDKLKGIPAAEGTLLDHTMVLFGSGMGNGNQHDHDNLPILVAGGGPAWSSGRHVVLPTPTPCAPRPTSRASPATSRSG